MRLSLASRNTPYLASRTPKTEHGVNVNLCTSVKLMSVVTPCIGFMSCIGFMFKLQYINLAFSKKPSL